MRTSWTTTVSAGITASIAIVLFMVLIPQILGLGSIDITKNLGVAFSSNSPHLAGSLFLAALGIFWSGIFGILYSSLPGNAITKGITYGLMVGLFSQAILPNVMKMIDGVVGAPDQYLATSLGMDSITLITLVAYVVFGVTLAFTLRPTTENAV